MATYRHKDHLYRQAKEEGYRSRAAYKLLELDKRYHLLKGGMKVLDLGAAPGGWLQIAAQKVGPAGRVVGIDLEPITPFSAVELGGGRSPILIAGDISDPEFREQLREELAGPANLILSDMSPKLSGIRFRDVAQAAELAGLAFFLAVELLVEGGSLVAKLFPGPEADQLFQRFRRAFNPLQRVNLESSRKSSTELYFVGRGFNRTKAQAA